MTRTSAELLLLAALLTATWIAVSHAVRSPAAPGPAGRAQGPARQDPAGEGLSDRASRLRAYLSSPPPRSAVRRNPFSFPQARHAAAAAVESASAPGSMAIESRPDLVLSGIAEDVGTAGPARTAVIAVAGQLVFAKEGDRVLSRFVVLRIAADAVQIKDTERGEVFTLAFK